MNDPEDVADKSAEDANTMKAVAKKTRRLRKIKVYTFQTSTPFVRNYSSAY